jgi:hypothetical protein
VNGDDLKFRDLKVFPTNRPEDKQIFNEIRSLSQAVLQNGGSLYDIIELYSTNSVRDMKKVFKTLKERQEQLEDQKMQQQQQQIEQQQQIAQSQMAQAQQMQAEKIANDNYQSELDRLNKVQVAMINAESKAGPLMDADTSGTADVLEIDKLASEQSRAQTDYQAKMAEIQSKTKLAAEKLSVEREKLQVARENQANDLAIAKENAKGRAKKSK